MTGTRIPDSIRSQIPAAVKQVEAELGPYPSKSSVYSLVADRLGLKPTTVRSIYKKYLETGTTALKPRLGRRPKLTPRDIRRMCKIAKSRPQISLKEIQDALPSPKPGCSTIRKTLLREGFSYGPPIEYFLGPSGLPYSPEECYGIQCEDEEIVLDADSPEQDGDIRCKDEEVVLPLSHNLGPAEQKGVIQCKDEEVVLLSSRDFEPPEQKGGIRCKDEFDA